MSNHPICSWQRSPLYAAMLDALTECGLADQADLARITDPDVWARKGDRHWPTRDLALRARFDALWTEKVQARCGINPDQSPAQVYNASLVGKPILASHRAAERQQKQVLREAVVARYTADEALTITDVAVAFDLKRDTVAKYLRDADVDIRPVDPRRAARVRWSDPSQHATQAARMLARHAEGRTHAA